MACKTWYFKQLVKKDCAKKTQHGKCSKMIYT